MNKFGEIILWTVFFFVIYFPTSYFIELYVGSTINFAEMLFVGTLFALLLVVILFLLIPEKIVEEKENIVEVVDDLQEESYLPQEKEEDVFQENENAEAKLNEFSELIQDEILEVKNDGQTEDFG